MKRIFTIITILITLSVIGIIVLQLSWLNNMVLLRQEQIKEKVTDAIKIVGEELAQYKGNFLTPNRSAASGNIFSEDYSSKDYLRPLTIGRRFSTQELADKIKLAFRQVGLEKMDFEFAVEIVNPPTIERQSQNFQEAIIDTVNNFNMGHGLITPSGSAAENIAIDETLNVVALDYKKFALQSLKWRFVTAIFFSLVIISAFYLTVRTMLRQKKLGEIKNDFINNMTHEFKTPLSSILLAATYLSKQTAVSSDEKLGKYA
ncbi:MAG TPA: histidine kinase dimerization/phospho-acceptor domain-containing protein, partial [Chitinophagaceae bacterium]